jgi:hypothetical protein
MAHRARTLYIHAYIHKYIHACIHRYLYIHKQTQTSYMVQRAVTHYIHTCIRTYIHKHMHTYIHTHTHTGISHTNMHTCISLSHTHEHTRAQVLGVDPANMDVSEQIAICSNIHIIGAENSVSPSHAHAHYDVHVEATSQGTHNTRPNDDFRVPDSEQRELSGQDIGVHVHSGAASTSSTRPPAAAAHTNMEGLHSSAHTSQNPHIQMNTAPSGTAQTSTLAVPVLVPVLPPPPLARNKPSPHSADAPRVDKDLIDLSTPPGGNSPRELLDGAW